MATLASLVVNLEANTAKYQSSIRSSSKLTTNFTKQLGVLAGALGFAGVTASVVRMSRGIINVNREFERLSAQLKTVTGSQEAANQAFKGLEQFASRTPFQIEENVQAFVRLRSIGLQPTMKEMENLGNIASAFGRRITDVAAGAIGAFTGSTERLTEMGIVTRILGDQISLTFNGVTETVDRNAQSVVDALGRIAESNFAGAMANEMDTLNGIISNIQDNFGALARKIGESVLPMLKDFASFVRDLAGIAARGGPDLVEAFTVLGDVSIQAFVAAFAKGFSSLAKLELAGIPLFGKVFTDAADEAASDAMLVVAEGLRTINDIANRSAGSVETLSNALAGDGGGGADSLASSLEEAKKAAVEAHKSLKDTLPTLEQRMQSALKANVAQLRVMGNAFEQEFKLRLPESLRDGLNFAAAVIPPAIDEMRETIKEKAVDVGESFIRGLVSGTQNLKALLRRAIDDIASTILIGGIKDLLKISSPSKVAMEIGQQYAEGLALGVGAGRGSVAMAGRSTAAGLVSAPRGGGGRTGPMIGELKVEMSVAALDARGVHEMLFSNRGAIAESFVTALNENSSLRALMRQL